MPESKDLRYLKEIWADNCHSMWGELLCVEIAQQQVRTDYVSIPQNQLLTERIYSPELKLRLGDATKDRFLQEVRLFRDTIITNRIVILCAAFETYFLAFVDRYLEARPKYFDKISATRTPDGNKIYGEIKKKRGLNARILEFSSQTGSLIRSLTPHLDYLNDLYILRNVVAHRAGHMDSTAASDLKTLTIAAGTMVVVNSAQIVTMAEHAILIAESLDKKINPK